MTPCFSSCLTLDYFHHIIHWSQTGHPSIIVCNFCHVDRAHLEMKPPVAVLAWLYMFSIEWVCWLSWTSSILECAKGQLGMLLCVSLVAIQLATILRNEATFQLFTIYSTYTSAFISYIPVGSSHLSVIQYTSLNFFPSLLRGNHLTQLDRPPQRSCMCDQRFAICLNNFPPFPISHFLSRNTNKVRWGFSQDQY